MSAPVNFIFHQGTVPLLVTMPHVGTLIAPEIRQTLSENALTVPDTDWHIEKLYAFARELGASVLQATWSRYVVDLNRPPDGASLYPGQATTGLCPENRFDGGPVYGGQTPDQYEVARRRELYWQPWHDKLQQTLDDMRSQFPQVVLWDAHSIRSVLPDFFSGRLPDFNIGTNSGTSCAPQMQQRVAGIARQTTFTMVENGRYKGGYITRHYGQPEKGIHALQMELAQSTYMDEVPPWRWDPQQARELQTPLKAMLGSVLEFAQGSENR